MYLPTWLTLLVLALFTLTSTTELVNAKRNCEPSNGMKLRECEAKIRAGCKSLQWVKRCSPRDGKGGCQVRGNCAAMGCSRTCNNNPGCEWTEKIGQFAVEKCKNTCKPFTSSSGVQLGQQCTPGGPGRRSLEMSNSGVEETKIEKLSKDIASRRRELLPNVDQGNCAAGLLCDSTSGTRHPVETCVLKWNDKECCDNDECANNGNGDISPDATQTYCLYSGSNGFDSVKKCKHPATEGSACVNVDENECESSTCQQFVCND